MARAPGEVLMLNVKALTAHAIQIKDATSSNKSIVLSVSSNRVEFFVLDGTWSRLKSETREEARDV
jgi:hypothetical protein